MCPSHFSFVRECLRVWLKSAKCFITLHAGTVYYDAAVALARGLFSTFFPVKADTGKRKTSKASVRHGEGSVESAESKRSVRRSAREPRPTSSSWLRDEDSGDDDDRATKPKRHLGAGPGASTRKRSRRTLDSDEDEKFNLRRSRRDKKRIKSYTFSGEEDDTDDSDAEGGGGSEDDE